MIRDRQKAKKSAGHSRQRSIFQRAYFCWREGAISFGHIGLIAIVVGIIAGLMLAFAPGFLLKYDEVWVAGDSLPACHLLSTSELKKTVMENDSIPSNAIRNITSNLSKGRHYCIIDPLEEDDFILEDNLVEIPNQSSLTIVGVPASHASALGCSIKPRDTIALVAPGFLSNNSSESKPWSIEDVTVLGILDNARSNGSEEYTLMVILPEDKALELINETTSKRAIALKKIS